MSIALNYHYVLDCVAAAAQDKELALELLSSMQPAIFKSYANISYLYLLMPCACSFAGRQPWDSPSRVWR